MGINVGDLTLGLNAQAWAVLALLSKSECDDLGEIEIRTHAWYNGRERGFCLEIRRGRRAMATRSALLVTCGEERCTDSIFVDAWEVDEFFLNPPTAADFTDEVFERRTSVPYANVDRAAEIICEKIKAFMGVLTIQPLSIGR